MLVYKVVRVVKKLVAGVLTTAIVAAVIMVLWMFSMAIYNLAGHFGGDAYATISSALIWVRKPAGYLDGFLVVYNFSDMVPLILPHSYQKWDSITVGQWVLP